VRPEGLGEFKNSPQKINFQWGWAREPIQSRYKKKNLFFVVQNKLILK
jgi:hypothetical protein